MGAFPGHSWERPHRKNKERINGEEVFMLQVSVFSELYFDLVRDRADRVLTARHEQYARHEQTQAKVKGEGETTTRVKQEENPSPKKNAAAEKARHEQHAWDADAHEFTIANALGPSHRVTAYPHAGDADAGNADSHEFTIAESASIAGKDGHEYAHALGQSHRVTPYPHAGHEDAGDYACSPH